MPGTFFEGEGKYNSMWGPEYIVYMKDCMKKSEIYNLIEEMTLIRVMELQELGI